MNPHHSTANRGQQMLSTDSLGYWAEPCGWSTNKGWKHGEVVSKDGSSSSSSSNIMSSQPRRLPAVAPVSDSLGYFVSNAMPCQATRPAWPKRVTRKDDTSMRDRTWTFVASSESQWHSPVESMTTSSSPNDLTDDMPYLPSSVSLFPPEDAAADLNSLATTSTPFNWNWNVMPSGQTLFGEVVFPVQPNPSATDQTGNMAFLPFDMSKTMAVGQVSEQARTWSSAPSAAVPTTSSVIDDLHSTEAPPSIGSSSSKSRLLAPKSANSRTEKTPFEPHLTHIVAEDGTSKTVGAIAKTRYVRPTYPRKMCNLCDEHPDGFRGDHELRRHMDRAHKTIRKMWVCVNASDNPKFLSGCKHCRNGKKYGAYYNAAAHLRRQHFNPRPTRGRGRNAVKAEERRGGKGGGDNPPMEVLKHYMKQVDEVVSAETDDELSLSMDENETGTGTGAVMATTTRNTTTTTTTATASTTANETTALDLDQDLFDIGSNPYTF